MEPNKMIELLIQAGDTERALEVYQQDKQAVLARKLSEVYEQVQYIQKSGWNDHHKYTYVEEAAIADKIRTALADRNVMVLPGGESCETTDRGLTTVKMSYVFKDGDNGAEIVRPWFGQGQDKQDKGIYKAYTGSLKYFLLKTFQIPTGDDPERTEHDKANAKSGGKASAPEPAEDARAVLWGLVETAMTTDMALKLEESLAQLYSYGSPSEMRPEQWAECLYKVRKNAKASGGGDDGLKVAVTKIVDLASGNTQAA